MFKPQFAQAVKAGRKLQTIRPVGKRPLNFGERISLRMWTGRPYNSRMIELRQVTIWSVEGVVVHHDGIEFSPGTLRNCFIGEHDRLIALNGLARADGFWDWDAMRAWFKANHGLPFRGQLIKWEL